MGPDVAENKLVAVGQRLRHTVDAGHAAGAANVFHDDRLTKFAAQSFGKNASNRIGRSAGGERYHHRYRPRRIVLRPRRERPRRRRAAEQADELAPPHVPLEAHSHCFTGFVGRGGLRFLLTRPTALRRTPTASRGADSTPAAAISTVARNACSWSSRLAALILGVRPASHP
jgi:hypothetical protein